MAGLLGFTLADLSGAVDSRKRQYANLVRGLLSDPGMTLAQLAQMDAEQTQRDRATLGNSRSVMPEVRQQAQEQDLMNTANAGGLLGMIAYHGSPHKFDKFDMSKIGTGEGAQAYGHGLYFAEQPDVARGYADRLGTKVMVNNKVHAAPNAEVERIMRIIARDPADAEKFFKTSIEPVAPPDQIADWRAAFEGVRGKNVALKKDGNLYKVDIPDDAVAKMLDWDKPLSQQPEAVRNALQKSWLAHPDVDGKLTGAQIYQRAGITLQGKEGTQAAAEQLRAAGIPGIRYLDAGSRGKGGTSNFVLFDDALPKILSRE